MQEGLEKRGLLLFGIWGRRRDTAKSPALSPAAKRLSGGLGFRGFRVVRCREESRV